jgi:hypothetical protein
MTRAAVACLLVSSLSGVGCSSSPPPRWQEGGAALAIGPARWDRAKRRPVEIRAEGSVYEGKREIFVIDRAGRVTDEDHEPLAILLPDGLVAGPDDTNLGRVGVSNAAPPHSASAWLAVMPNGEVVFFDSDGDRKAGGAWSGCRGAMHRTCTLVTHMVALRNYRDPYRSPSVGVGIGIGF